MKNNILLLALFLFLTSGFVAAQAPNAINYQGVARDNTGNPLPNQNIGLQFSIREGSTSGTLQYQEQHTVTTNGFGLFSLKIGEGTAVSGAFTNVDWGADDHFIEVEIDPAGGSSYTSLTNTQLVSVPYALHANTVENDAVDDADADSTNEIQDISLTGTNLSISSGSTVDLSVLQDGFTDADADSTNELQTLSINNDTLSISGGNSVVLPTGPGGGADADWTISGANITNANTGAVSIGNTTALQLFNIGTTDSFRVQIGHVGGFNQAQSGRLVFNEDIAYNGTCGFEFHHDGAANTLSIESGCPTLMDTSIVFTRNGEVRIPERLRVGKNLNPLADLHVTQTGGGGAPGSSGIRLEDESTSQNYQMWTGGGFMNFAYNGMRVSYINNLGQYIIPSDRRFKANIATLTPMLSSVMALNPVRYNYKYDETETPTVGFIAQEVQAIFPEMVSVSPGTEYLALPYTEFSVIAIKAIQEQQTIIDGQQAEIDALKSQVEEIEDLKAAVKALQAQMK